MPRPDAENHPGSSPPETDLEEFLPLCRSHAVAHHPKEEIGKKPSPPPLDADEQS